MIQFLSVVFFVVRALYKFDLLIIIYLKKQCFAVIVTCFWLDRYVFSPDRRREWKGTHTLCKSRAFC